MATVLPILPSERSLAIVATNDCAAPVIVPRNQKLFGHSLAQLGARSLSAVTARCGYPALVELRSDGQVQSGSPGGKMKSTLSCRDQPLDCRHGIVDVALIIVLDDLDRQSLADALEHDATSGIHFLDPKAVVGKHGDARACHVRTAQRDRIADPDLGFGVWPCAAIAARHHSCDRGSDQRSSMIVVVMILSAVGRLRSASARDATPSVLTDRLGQPRRHDPAIDTQVRRRCANGLFWAARHSLREFVSQVLTTSASDAVALSSSTICLNATLLDATQRHANVQSVHSVHFQESCRSSASVVLVVGVGVGQILKSTVDQLLYWDATAAAESWAKYVAENVTDIEEIADGQQPSAESMAFLIRTQQIRHVFGFEIINVHGNVQLTSDGSKISIVGGAVHSEAAARAAASGQPIISVKEGTPPVRPRYYSEAYLPVIVDGRPAGYRGGLMSI